MQKLLRELQSQRPEVAAAMFDPSIEDTEVDDSAEEES